METANRCPMCVHFVTLLRHPYCATLEFGTGKTLVPMEKVKECHYSPIENHMRFVDTIGKSDLEVEA